MCSNVKAPALRGLLTKQIARNLGMMCVVNVAVLFAKKMFIDNPRKKRYKDWHSQLDPQRMYEEMVVAGVIWSDTRDTSEPERKCKCSEK